MTTPIIPCYSCQHWDKDMSTCEAFPEGIPVEILTGSNFHRETIKGDHGLQYEPLNGLEDDLNPSFNGLIPQYFDPIFGEKQ